MTIRYLFGPVTAPFVDQNLRGPYHKKHCLPFRPSASHGLGVPPGPAHDWEPLGDLPEGQEPLAQPLHAEVQRPKQRLAQYEPEILRDPPPSPPDPPPPSPSYSGEGEERRPRPRRRRKKSPGRRPTELKFAE